MPTSSASPINDTDLVATLPGFRNAYREVNGIRLHYVALGLGGISYDFLAAFLSTAAPGATVLKLPNIGHWLPDEQPDEIVRLLTEFFG